MLLAFPLPFSILRNLMVNFISWSWEINAWVLLFTYIRSSYLMLLILKLLLKHLRKILLMLLLWLSTLILLLIVMLLPFHQLLIRNIGSTSVISCVVLL